VGTNLTTVEPRYATIKRFVLDSVAEGRLRAGDRIPSEHEFVDMFDVSRMTVTRAMLDLKAEGVLISVAGVGSFIAEPKPQLHIIEVRNIADEVRARGHEYSARVVRNGREKATRENAGYLGVAAGTALFHSLIVHHESGRPIQLEDRLVLASAAPDYGSLDFTIATPNSYLSKVAPLERVAHRVRAVMPDDRTRALLGMSEGTPSLLLIRQTWSAARIVSYAELYHPGPSFEFSDSFEP
jgi:GntR family histidine utilization transcriptional repressor